MDASDEALRSSPFEAVAHNKGTMTEQSNEQEPVPAGRCGFNAIQRCACVTRVTPYFHFNHHVNRRDTRALGYSIGG